MHFYASKQSNASKHLLFFSVLVGVVDDVAEGSSKGTVELNLRPILVPASPVQVGVNKRLHRVDVQDVARDLVIRVREDLGSQGQVHIVAQVRHFKEHLPVCFVCYLKVLKLSLIVPVLFFVMQIEYLCLHELVPDLSECGKVRNFFLKHK